MGWDIGVPYRLSMIHAWSPILRRINSVVVMGTIIKYRVWKRYGHCIRKFGIQKKKRRLSQNKHKERERGWNHF